MNNSNNAITNAKSATASVRANPKIAIPKTSFFAAGFLPTAVTNEAKKDIEKKEKDINQKLNEKVVKAEKQIMETQKLVIKEVINNTEELTAKVIQNLTDLKYDKVDGKKAINTASKNILVEK